LPCIHNIHPFRTDEPLGEFDDALRLSRLRQRTPDLLITRDMRSTTECKLEQFAGNPLERGYQRGRENRFALAAMYTMHDHSGSPSLPRRPATACPFASAPSGFLATETRHLRIGFGVRKLPCIHNIHPF